MSPTVSSPALPTARLVSRLARRALPFAVLVAAACGGCSADHTRRTLLLQPHGGEFRIEGNVVLTGTMLSETQDPLGDLIVTDATDCEVHLEGPDGYRDSILTHDGEYHFHVEHPGHYRVSSCVVAGDTASSVDVVVGDHDTTVVASVLTVASPAGNIRSYPNPLDAHGAGVEATLATPQDVEIFVTTLFGFRVWSYAFHADAGFHHIHWPATNDLGQEVPDGTYWAVFHADGAYAFALLSKQTAAPGSVATMARRALAPARRAASR